MARYQIERRKLSDQVIQQLEQDIVSAHFKPGDRLPSERALMEQFGVGRPTIREALFSLEKMGLVALASGSRARVIRPTPAVVLDGLSGVMGHLLSNADGQRHFQHARAMFETAMARHAALHAQAADIHALRGALADNAATLGNDAEFKRTDIAFHGVLAAIPGNPVYPAVHDAMAQWLDDRRAVALEQPGQDRIALIAHERIVETIEHGDPEAADAAMRDHLDQHYGVYRRMRAGGKP
ncbi:transcriptional regulator NanR [Salinisphaera sp.]|uniref:transcriptional regulator NanR n=1 Tax=Salinisphaera sp. TaxID=1914330 RepID=UPI002D767D7B|nr:transcriptional regulator NanR [Salinisphaera sp.]HET7314237.1 transcriptional regulator NanR [Salinisphaera sp.]